MTVFLGYILAFFSFAAIADDLSVVTSDKKIFFQGNDCTPLIEEAKSIWLKRAGEKIDCSCKAGICSLDATNLFPATIRQLILSKNSKIYGPNCWNTVLFTQDYAVTQSYSEDEIEFWFNSPLCKMVSPAPTLPGDTFNISMSGLSSHVFQAISKNFILNKATPEKSDGYTVMKLADLYKASAVPENCSNIIPNDPKKRFCQRAITVYRCARFTDFLNQEPLNSELESTRKMLNEVAAVFNRAVLTGDQTDLSRQKDLILAIEIKARHNLKFPEAEIIPNAVLTKLKTYLSLDDSGSEEQQRKLKNGIARFSLLSQSDMEVLRHAPADKELVELFRKNQLYDSKPVRNFLLWSQIYLASTSLRLQLEIAESH